MRPTGQGETDWREVWATYRLDPEVYNQPLFIYQIAEYLSCRGEEQAALAAFHEALEYDPGNQRALQGLISLLQKRGLQEEAATYLRQLLLTETEQRRLPEEVQNDIMAFRGAIQGIAPVPPRAPVGYVAAHFDGYADHFDVHLCQTLHYRGPELLQEALTRLGLPSATPLDVLDAGCGTGLAGPLFRSWARQLDGVDLSPRMLARARDRGCYDRLDVGELTQTMLARPRSYDLVLAADVLVYFGDLNQSWQPSGRPCGRAVGLLSSWNAATSLVSPSVPRARTYTRRTIFTRRPTLRVCKRGPWPKHRFGFRLASPLLAW